MEKWEKLIIDGDNGDGKLMLMMTTATMRYWTEKGKRKWEAAALHSPTTVRCCLGRRELRGLRWSFSFRGFHSRIPDGCMVNSYLDRGFSCAAKTNFFLRDCSIFIV